MRNVHRQIRTVASCLGLATALGWTCCAQGETPAGTTIRNVAQLAYTAAGQDGTVASNESTIVTAERLDVALAARPLDGTTVSATLTNQGNGQEAFTLAAAASAGTDHVVRLAIDGDGDGRYDPAHDAEIVAGRTPVLAPGQSVVVFVVLTTGTTGTVTLSTAAATGSGTPGTVFANAGDGGGDAVTGPTGAAAQVVVALAPVAGAAPTLTKTAAVVAPDGSALAVRGAAITYTLVARFPAATAAARVTDAIPAGTTYAPASLSLDDVGVSDAADTDAGTATSTGIAVALGDQPAGAVRTVRFKVIVQ